LKIPVLSRTASLSLLAVTLLASGCGDSRAESRGQDAGGAPGRGGPPGAGAARAIPVAARTAQPGALNVTLRGTANLQARDQVEILPKQGGVVSRIFVEEGARVRAGQPLAALDDEEWRLQARQAEARAEAARDAAERGVALHGQGLLADQELQRLRSEAEIAAADRDLARLRARNAVITSPITGTVTHRWIERGQLVTPSTPAFAVADVSRLEALLGVPEREAQRIRPGQTAVIRAEGGAAPVRGRVSRIRPVVDPQSGTVQVTVEVDPASAPGLRAGQFVNVDVVTERLEDRITVPRTAVLVDGPRPRVFIVQDGQAAQREVVLGTNEGDQVEIREGLNPGDTVVIVGQDALRPGAQVRLVELNGERMAEADVPPAAREAGQGTGPGRPDGAGGAPRGERRRPQGAGGGS
jgi:membrane fusion protein (multidrug efflux system)